MASLAAKKGTAETSKPGRKVKLSILDMDRSGDEDQLDDDGEGVSLMERERKYHDSLVRAHSNCQVCGPTVSCKISANGTHTLLTANMLRSWANALVCRYKLSSHHDSNTNRHQEPTK